MLRLLDYRILNWKTIIVEDLWRSAGCWVSSHISYSCGILFWSRSSNHLKWICTKRQSMSRNSGQPYRSLISGLGTFEHQVSIEKSSHLKLKCVQNSLENSWVDRNYQEWHSYAIGMWSCSSGFFRLASFGSLPWLVIMKFWLLILLLLLIMFGTCLKQRKKETRRRWKTSRCLLCTSAASRETRIKTKVLALRTMLPNHSRSN